MSTKTCLRECDFCIDGMPMEMVSSYCHLGHLVTSSMDDSLDIMSRQSGFIGQVDSVLCFFGKLSSGVKIRLFRSYIALVFMAVNCGTYHEMADERPKSFKFTVANALLFASSVVSLFTSF